MDLSHDIGAPYLDLARLVAAHDLVEVLAPGDTGRRGMRAVGHPALAGLLSPQTDDADYLALYALAELVRDGAKVVRPSPELCRVLRHVDLDLGVRDDAQPFTSLGSLIPGGVLGLGRDALAVALWLPDRGLHVVGFLDGGATLIWSTTDIRHPETLEESLGVHEEGPRDVARPWTVEDEGRCRAMCRIAVNLGLLATEKGVRVAQLDRKAERRRRRSGGDERMARLATRDAREVVIRDVDLIVRAGRAPCRVPGEGGWHQPMHMRRGHWRMQPVGRARARKRRIWVSPYWVGLDEGVSPPTHITTVLA